MSEPTPGAMRAAEKIDRATKVAWTKREIEELAAIIDVETGVAELLAACKLAVASWFNGEVSEICMETTLRAAIQQAERK